MLAVLIGLALPVLTQPALGQSAGPPTDATGVVTNWAPNDALARMTDLGVARYDGPVDVFVSRGHEGRGRELAEMLAQANDFYLRVLGVGAPVVLAFLDEADWKRVTPVPYGFPHPFMGSPNVVFIGATPHNAAVEDLISRREFVRPDDLARATALGITWDDASALLLDLVGFHELGHIYTSALAISTHTRWFSEMLATYIGYAFLREMRPELVGVWDGGLGSTMSSPRPAHTSLADFERLYVGVGVPNYQWYQGAFHERVKEVYDAQGVDFIHSLVEALPTDSEQPLSTTDLLARLERIEPGFHAWADRLGLLTK